MKSKITIEDGVMKHIQEGNGETIITTRTINGDTMTVVSWFWTKVLEKSLHIHTVIIVEALAK